MSIDNLSQVMSQFQSLVKMNGEQFQAMRTVIVESQSADQKKHQSFMEEMEAAKVSREATMQLLASLDQSIRSLQEVVTALINLSQEQADQQKQLAGA